MIAVVYILAYLALGVLTVRAFVFYDDRCRRYNEFTYEVAHDRRMAGFIATVWPVAAVLGLAGLLAVALGRLGGAADD